MTGCNVARRYALIIFDWDGTLMDSTDEIVDCIQRAAMDLGAPRMADATVRNIIGLGLSEAVTTLFPDSAHTFTAQLAERYRHHQQQQCTTSALFAGVPALLDELSARGYLLAIATGKSRAGLNRMLRQTALQSFFHATRCADESKSKPDPSMVEQIMETLGVEKHQALIVGDTEYDLGMARNAGIAAIGVSYGAHSADRLAAYAPVAVIDHISELLTYVLTEE